LINAAKVGVHFQRVQVFELFFAIFVAIAKENWLIGNGKRLEGNF
jgi:hypothetical protein